jgi:hypothetical protein
VTDGRFLPQDAEVRESVLEFERRSEGGEKVPLIGRVVCHHRSIGQVWDLGPGRALFLSTKSKTLPTIIGGGQTQKADHRYQVIEACLPETPPPARLPGGTPEEVAAAHRARVAEARRPMDLCPVGHHSVFLTRSDIREAVARFRQGKTGNPFIITLKVEHTDGGHHVGVLASVT